MAVETQQSQVSIGEALCSCNSPRVVTHCPNQLNKNSKQIQKACKKMPCMSLVSCKGVWMDMIAQAAMSQQQVCCITVMLAQDHTV